jgi:hypothetical protein
MESRPLACHSKLASCCRILIMVGKQRPERAAPRNCFLPSKALQAFRNGIMHRAIQNLPASVNYRLISSLTRRGLHRAGLWE